MRSARSIASMVALAAAWVAVGAATVVRFVNGSGLGTSSGGLVVDLAWSCTWGAFAAVGYVVGRERPDNRIGPMFLAMGVLGSLGDLAQSVAAWLVTSTGTVAALAGWVSTWAWAPSLALVVWSVMLFPNGHPLGPRWRMIGPAAFALSMVAAVTNAITFWPQRSPRLVLIQELPDSLAGRVIGVVFPLFLVCSVAGLVSLVLRFRRARGMERQQLKWGAVGAMVMGPALILGETVFTSGPLRVAADVLSAPVWLAIAAGIAITRHGLYDVDRVISRTIAYGTVTALLGALYAGSVVATTALLPVGTDEIGVALSTLVVAGSFGPVRRRVQSLVDRRFNRPRVDAARTIEKFAERVRDQVDLRMLGDEVSATVAAALQPRQVALWVATHQPDRTSRSIH